MHYQCGAVGDLPLCLAPTPKHRSKSSHWRKMPSAGEKSIVSHFLVLGEIRLTPIHTARVRGPYGRGLCTTAMIMCTTPTLEPGHLLVLHSEGLGCSLNSTGTYAVCSHLHLSTQEASHHSRRDAIRYSFFFFYVFSGQQESGLHASYSQWARGLTTATFI